MIIQTTILYCDGTDGDRKCESRLLITNTLQPLIEGLDRGWKMVNPERLVEGERSETKHFCRTCARRLKLSAPTRRASKS